MLRFVAFSSSRVGGLASYLEALAASEQPQPTGFNPSPKRRRLHILYLLNDLFHHCKYHLGTTTTFSTVSGSLQPHIVNLVSHAATYDRQKNPRHHRRLDQLLDLWSEHGYFHPELIAKLREVVINSAIAGFAPSPSDMANEANQVKKSGKDVPFALPSTHGDPSTPWCDLPSGNIFPHIIPNSTIPLRPDATKPIHLLAGPADGKSVDALKGFFIEVDNIFSPDDLKNDGHADSDELGQSVTRDSLDGERYHGWSRESCQQMKNDPDNSSSGSLSRSGSRTPKRRRYSDSSLSGSDSMSPSRSRFRSQRSDVHRHHDSRSRSPRARGISYKSREPPISHFPPPHQPQHAPAPTNPFPRAHNPNGQYSQSSMGSNVGYPHQSAPNYGSWPPPQHMPAMPFPPLGAGFPPSAFPPPYHHSPSSMPMSMPMPPSQGQGQVMPPGQYHFPPPYSGGQQGGPWGPPQGGRGR